MQSQRYIPLDAIIAFRWIQMLQYRIEVSPRGSLVNHALLVG
jgi:hypothetical protein